MQAPLIEAETKSRNKTSKMWIHLTFRLIYQRPLIESVGTRTFYIYKFVCYMHIVRPRFISYLLWRTTYWIYCEMCSLNYMYKPGSQCPSSCHTSWTERAVSIAWETSLWQVAPQILVHAGNLATTGAAASGFYKSVRLRNDSDIYHFGIADALEQKRTYYANNMRDANIHNEKYFFIIIFAGSLIALPLLWSRSTCVAVAAEMIIYEMYISSWYDYWIALCVNSETHFSDAYARGANRPVGHKRPKTRACKQNSLDCRFFLFWTKAVFREHLE